MSPPRVLDLFCGAGGAAMGLHRAWPDADITGVDIRPMARYPFRFVQADAMAFPLDGYDFIWASPPCQHYTAGKREHRARGDNAHPDLLGAVRERLEATGAPYVIENVLGAPIRSVVMLCGEMFGLRVQRHRFFESNVLFFAPAHPKHRGTLFDGYYVPVYGSKWQASGANGPKGPLPLESGRIETWREAMGIDWMTKAELAEAIPPAYTEYLARQYGPLTRVLGAAS